MFGNFTGKERFWAVVGAAWILLVLFALAPWEQSRYESGNWKRFFIFGVVPIACVVAFFWIRRGFYLERERSAKAAIDSKNTVTCPGCSHQIRRNTLEQSSFNCTRCNTKFYRCSSCGNTSPG